MYLLAIACHLQLSLFQSAIPDDLLSGRDREDSQNPVPVSRSIVEQVLKDGGGISSNDSAFDHLRPAWKLSRTGWASSYAESFDPDELLNNVISIC